MPNDFGSVKQGDRGEVEDWTAAAGGGASREIASWFDGGFVLEAGKFFRLILLPLGEPPSGLGFSHHPPIAVSKSDSLKKI
jgi:hypothetical protein